MSCPVGATVQCFGNLPAAYSTLALFSAAGGTASDNCGLVTSSFSLVSQTASGTCPRTVTRTYSIQDSCNNVASCSQAFIVDDNAAPAISCPAGVTVQCFGNLPAAYTTLALFSAAGGTASDNCGLVVSTFTLVSQTASGTCPRTVTRTYSIADSCNNVSSCTQIFTVGDNTAPAISCPAGTTVQCFGDLPAAYSTLALFSAAGGTASDNCGLVVSTFTLVSQTASGTCPRTVTRTYSIKDSCNNNASCSQAFIVDDNSAPAISCPAGVTVQCFGSLPAAYSTLAQFSAAGGTASDNCGLVVSTFTLVNQTASGTCPRTVTRTYSIADSCGNVSSCSQAFTVSDNNPPVISCPAGTTVQCFGNLPAAYSTLALFSAAGGTASDNCGLMASTFTLVSQAASGTCPRTVTRTYSIADSCGNVSSCSQAFTVGDNTAPLMSCPVGATVQCFGNLPAAYSTLALFSAAGGNASDNCGLVVSTFTLISQTASGTCPRTVTRTYSIQDSCNNVASCSQAFIVE